ncbi:MAG: hypothetical protein DMG91_00585 [Acidobacteria bacterium]|nr:MAG: hypothetical protein DMG91_00585 [Acidobacteriota bacterium]
MLSQHLEFDPARQDEFFSALPSSAAVFLLRSHDPGGEPYISKTANLRRRLQRLLEHSGEPSRKLNLRELARKLEFSETGSDFESNFLLYRLTRKEFPQAYTRRLRLRFAPLVKLHLKNQYPRASITNRLGSQKSGNVYYGPFSSRAAAETFANDALDFFKMRRCVEDLRPDPAFPGCIYSEMKMCLAPCFKGCSDEEYAAEVARVKAFWDTGGESLVREITLQREVASSRLAFEEASAIHSRLEKLEPVIRQLPGIVRRIDELSGVIVQRSTEAECVNLFVLQRGTICDPLIFAIRGPEHAKSQSMEARVQEAIAGAQAAEAASATERMEHLAILKRWYFRGKRAGELFLTDQGGALPMRRLVRGISRVYRGEKEDGVVPATSEQTRGE